MTSSGRKLRRAARKQDKAGGPARRAVRRRVHLRLVADPNSGQQQLQLANPVFQEDWQNRMTLATANTAFAMLSESRTAVSAARLGEKAMDSTSSLVDSLLSRAPEGALACRAGCAHCCHQSVGVTVPEALAIVQHLLETRTPAELEELSQRLERAHQRTRGLTRDRRNSVDHPCPLLVDNLCSIYPVRPLACRGVHSLDEQACAKKLHDPAQRAAYERGELPGHSFVEPVRAVHAISAGMQLGLWETLGLDMRPLDLTAVLYLLLCDLREAARHVPGDSADASDARLEPELTRRWLQGARAFADAYGGDATDLASQVALAGAVSLAPRTEQ